MARTPWSMPAALAPEHGTTVSLRYDGRVSYRDDGHAAQARADALARELDEERRRRERAEEEAAALGRENQALSDQVAHAESSAPARARRQLAELTARAPATDEPRRGAPVAIDRRSPRARKVRLAHSAGGLASVDPAAILTWSLPAGLVLGVAVACTPAPDIAFAMVAPGTVAVLLLAWMWARATGLSRIMSWTETRPYQVRGLTTALAQPPVINEWVKDPDAHTTLKLDLHFDGSPPANLREILVAVDPELSVRGTMAERPSPVSRSETGRSRYRLDHNGATMSWLKRLDREALSPLHHAHGLAAVDIELR